MTKMAYFQAGEISLLESMMTQLMICIYVKQNPNEYVSVVISTCEFL